MAVTIANQVRNHRGLYAEVTGDGATTALVFNHNMSVHAGTTATASVITAPTTAFETRSGKGGFKFATGTAVTVSSVSVTATTVTVNTSAAIGNGTVAYVVVVLDQSSATL